MRLSFSHSTPEMIDEAVARLGRALQTAAVWLSRAGICRFSPSSACDAALGRNVEDLFPSAAFDGSFY